MTALTQPQLALELANEVRHRNAVTKIQVARLDRHAGYKAVAEIIDSPDGPGGALQVGQLINAIHRVNDATSGPLLIRAGVYKTSRRVRDLTPRQRAALVTLLNRKARGA